MLQKLFNAPINNIITKQKPCMDVHIDPESNLQKCCKWVLECRNMESSSNK